jgi:UMF1 family MFS transporter
MFLFVPVQHYYVASLLAVISNSAYGAVSVCGNAYLPILVNARFEEINRIESLESQAAEEGGSDQINDNGEYQRTSSEADISSDQDNLLTGLLRRSKYDNSSTTVAKSRLSGRISGFGFAIGYFAAFLTQIFTIILVIKTGSTVRSLQFAVFTVGMWWLVFQIPVKLLLKSRPGPPLPEKYHGRWYGYILYGWATLGATFKEARQMRDVVTFLVGWFMISDGATTINATAVLFAQKELAMKPASLATLSLLTMVSGMMGATLLPRFQARLGKNPINGLLFVIAIASVIPFYGIMGFFNNTLGLIHPWEMYILAFWYGFALGGLGAGARSIFSLLIPQGKETTFFALYAVTDKGSSIFGPFISAYITDQTHNIRYTFYFLLIMMILPIGVFWLVDVERGTKEAHYLEDVEG